MKYSKRVLSLLLVVCFICTSMVGCSSSSATDIDYTQTVLTVDGEEISLDMVNFYARYEQSYTETYYMAYFGDDMWESEVDTDVTYEDYMKDFAMETIQELVVIKQHADEYGVIITDEEMEAIEVVAQEFYDTNTGDSDAIIAASCSVDTVAKVLELYLYDYKIYEAIAEEIDTEIVEEEVAQKEMSYIYFVLYTEDDTTEEGYVEFTDAEKAVVYAEAEAFIEAVGEDGDLYTIAEEMGYEPVTINFNTVTEDEETTYYNMDVSAVLDTYTEGQVSGVIESSMMYYVAQLTSEYDEEATEATVESILTDRKDTLYSEITGEWISAAECVIVEAVWDLISYIDLGITSAVSE